ncbi:unnamed protein product [Spirodela intermedia]|uniref:Uncharacterized protein n=1 Tax=Spirodela intermedia TaxID=51605 RepID=A0A7I8K475_SPIIN|nr:unnamed protein product [Spirodela intermedia]
MNLEVVWCCSKLLFYCDHLYYMLVE